MHLCGTLINNERCLLDPEHMHHHNINIWLMVVHIAVMKRKCSETECFSTSSHLSHEAVPQYFCFVYGEFGPLLAVSDVIADLPEHHRAVGG